VGGGSGALTGGTLGYGAYKYRIEIKNGVVNVRRKALDSMGLAKAKAKRGAIAIKGNACEAATYTKTKTGIVLNLTRTKACELAAGTVDVARNRKFQVTVASAAAGTVAGSVAGGGMGTLAGATVGAVVGFVPAIFTLGLSIPIGAVIGGGTGFCTGVVAGGSVGVVGGGAAGYGGFTYRKEIGSKISGAWTRACASADFVKTKAKDSAVSAKGSLLGLVSGTGGTKNEF